MPQQKSYDFLIVDDEKQICLILSRWINNEGYSCLSTHSGEKAQRLLDELSFSVVITDIMMPNVSGIDLLKHIKSTKSEIPVIMITGLDDQQTIKTAYDLGAYGYMNKPLQQNNVLSNIINALQRRKLEIENKLYSQKLESLLETRTKEIEDALSNVSQIMDKIINEEDFNVRFDNPSLQDCYKIMHCRKKDCPCFGKGKTRCWQVCKTSCQDHETETFIKKYQTCCKCPVFLKSTSSYTMKIGEHFNNMMNMLATKHYQLADSYEQLKQSQKQVVTQEKMATLGLLSAGIAHEINTPIGYVSSNLKMMIKYTNRIHDFLAVQTSVLKNSASSQELADVKIKRKKKSIDSILIDQKDLLTESIEGCQHIQSIVSDLKIFSRDDTNKPTTVNLNDVIKKTINVARNELKYKTQVIKQLEELPDLQCYPNKISQIILNLLINASQAIKEDGEIVISSKHKEDTIIISVTDNGCGISSEKLETIFEPFYTTKEEEKGTGLGLTISSSIAQKHHGSLSVESIPGQGSTFTLSIPVVFA